MAAAQDRFRCSGRAWEPAGPRDRAVAVLMSGGVDSSVAAAVLREAGHDVVGITMHVPSALAPDGSEAEPRADSGADAARVARELDIPHYVVDVRDAFRRLVIDPFRDAYRRGRTPSPCIGCNTHVKFGVVPRLVREAFGIEQLATGHYARIETCDDGPGLFTARHRAKDQSYFLYGIERTRLAAVRFPLGAWTKDRTRDAADRLGLDVSSRAESAELCFAGQADYRAALGPEPDAGPGDVLDLAGQVLGRHRGISNYTVGQREGLGIALGVPMYVVDIDPERNTVTLGDRAAAGRRRVRAAKLNVLAPDALQRGGRLFGKVRSRLEAAPCTVVELRRDAVTVEFDAPEHGVTPGQHLVLYAPSGRVIAGAEIKPPAGRGD